MRGDIGVRNGITRIISVSLVVGLVLSLATYNEYITSFFTVGIPNFFGTVLSNGTATTGPGTFYQILINTQKVFAEAGKGVSSLNIFGGVVLAFLDMLSFVPIAILFMFYELTKVLIELVVCLGPFVLPGYLFAATKGVADRFISKLIGLTLLILLVDITLSIMDNAINMYCASVLSSIASGQSAGWFGTTEDVAATIFVCMQLVIFLIICVLMMTFLPGIASSIGGGVSVSPLAIANAASNASSYIPGRGPGGDGAGGGAGRAGASTAQRPAQS
jgi:type IV secretion system protein VirB6